MEILDTNLNNSSQLFMRQRPHVDEPIAIVLTVDD